MVLVVVMGVSGSGKSTVGRTLAEAYAVPFIEGDARHPPENIAKMSAGIPLDDDDRRPWLMALGRELAALSGQGGGVLACSALKRSYRDLLRHAAGPALRFVHLTGERAVLEARMQHRTGHFMPATLLDSQLATLEPTDGEADAVEIAFDLPLDVLVATARRFLD